MSDGTYTVTLKCACGGDKFSPAEGRTAETVITCAKCGATGKYGELMEQAKAQITKQYADAFSNIFKKK